MRRKGMAQVVNATIGALCRATGFFERIVNSDLADLIASRPVKIDDI